MLEHVGEERWAAFPIGWLPYFQGNARLYAVYIALASYVSNDGRCYPSLRAIEELTGIDRANVQRTLVKLEKLGAIERTTKQGHSSSYLLLKPPTYGGSNKTFMPVAKTANAKTAIADSAFADSAAQLLPNRQRTVADLAAHNRPGTEDDLTGRPSGTEPSRTHTSAHAPAYANGTTTHASSHSASANTARRDFNDLTPNEQAVILHCSTFWADGISKPLPPELVETYRMLAPVYDLPKRPGF